MSFDLINTSNRGISIPRSPIDYRKEQEEVNRRREEARRKLEQQVFLDNYRKSIQDMYDSEKKAQSTKSKTEENRTKAEEIQEERKKAVAIRGKKPIMYGSLAKTPIHYRSNIEEATGLPISAGMMAPLGWMAAPSHAIGYTTKAQAMQSTKLQARGLGAAGTAYRASNLLNMGMSNLSASGYIAAMSGHYMPSFRGGATRMIGQTLSGGALTGSSALFGGIGATVLASLASSMMKVRKERKIHGIPVAANELVRKSSKFRFFRPLIDQLMMSGDIKPGEALTLQILGLIEQWVSPIPQYISSQLTKEEYKSKSAKFGVKTVSKGEKRSGLLDTLEYYLQKFTYKFNPLAQLGLLVSGKTVRGMLKNIEEIYKKQPTHKEAKERGVSYSSFQILHVSANSLMNRVKSYEAQILSILAGTYELSRLSSAELITIRRGAYGIADNDILKYRQGESVSSWLSKIYEYIPGIAAIGNVVKTGFKVFKFFKNFVSNTQGIADKLLGRFGSKYEDPYKILEELGLTKPIKQEATEYIAKGLPGALSSIFTSGERRLEVLQDIHELLEHSITGTTSERKFDAKTEHMIWDSLLGRYLSIEDYEKESKRRMSMIEQKMLPRNQWESLQMKLAEKLSKFGYNAIDDVRDKITETFMHIGQELDDEQRKREKIVVGGLKKEYDKSNVIGRRLTLIENVLEQTLSMHAQNAEAGITPEQYKFVPAGFNVEPGVERASDRPAEPSPQPRSIPQQSQSRPSCFNICTDSLKCIQPNESETEDNKQESNVYKEMVEAEAKAAERRKTNVDAMLMGYVPAIADKLEAVVKSVESSKPKKKKGMFSWLIDGAKNIFGKVFGSVGSVIATVTGALTAGLGSFLGTAGGGMFASVAGAGLVGISAAVVGYGIYKIVTDSIAGYKKDGITGLISGMFGPSSSIWGTMGKYAAIGGGIGLAIASLPGLVAGTTIGSAVGWLVDFVFREDPNTGKSLWDNTVDWFSSAIDQILQDPIIKKLTDYGSSKLGIPGAVMGFIAGNAISPIYHFFTDTDESGGASLWDKITDDISKVINTVSNDPIIKRAMTLGYTVLGIPGSVLGFISGCAISPIYHFLGGTDDSTGLKLFDSIVDKFTTIFNDMSDDPIVKKIMSFGTSMMGIPGTMMGFIAGNAISPIYHFFTDTTSGPSKIDVINTAIENITGIKGGLSGIWSFIRHTVLGPLEDIVSYFTSEDEKAKQSNALLKKQQQLDAEIVKRREELIKKSNLKRKLTMADKLQIDADLRAGRKPSIFTQETKATAKPIKTPAKPKAKSTITQSKRIESKKSAVQNQQSNTDHIDTINKMLKTTITTAGKQYDNLKQFINENTEIIKTLKESSQKEIDILLAKVEKLANNVSVVATPVSAPSVSYPTDSNPDSRDVVLEDPMIADIVDRLFATSIRGLRDDLVVFALGQPDMDIGI